MKIFDESKVFTAVNADKITIGSKGYFANSITSLKDAALDSDEAGLSESEIKFLAPPSEEHRFVDKCGESYALFYLVKEAKQKIYRPYKDNNEMVADFLERYNSFKGNSNAKNPMYKPLIWLRHISTLHEYLVVSFGFPNELAVVDTSRPVDFYNGLKTRKLPFDMQFLLYTFTYLDGSPCGKLMEES